MSAQLSFEWLGSSQSCQQRHKKDEHFILVFMYTGLQIRKKYTDFTITVAFHCLFFFNGSPFLN